MADSGDAYWIERAQSAEAKLNTLQENYSPALDRVKQFKANFGIRERPDGTIVIDFDKFAQNLGREQCLELRAIIDEKYQINGASSKAPTITRTRKRLDVEGWRRLGAALN